jgi:hypothetical protein
MATLASNRTSTDHRGIFLLFVFILSVLRSVLFGQNLSTVQAAARLTEQYAPSSVARTALVLHAGVQAKLPSEDVALPHLQQPVEILVDRWGVPHIHAKMKVTCSSRRASTSRENGSSKLIFGADVD